MHMLANGDTIEDFLTEYPSLEMEDILTCLNYAASLEEEQVKAIETLASGLTSCFSNDQKKLKRL